MSPVQAEAKRMWLDECVPVGVFDDEQSEQIWDACCASHPDNPFSEWEKSGKSAKERLQDDDLHKM